MQLTRACIIIVLFSIVLVEKYEARPSSTKSITSLETHQYLESFGYLDAGSSASFRDPQVFHSQDQIIHAIKKLQKYGSIPITGKLDDATIKLMETLRCGVSDIDNNAYKHRQKRYSIGDAGWRKNHLTYYIANWPKYLNGKLVYKEIARAFSAWSPHADLSFQQVFNSNADIIIKFAVRYHEDPYPFDGPGKNLAHAFYPYSVPYLGGDIHFDADESWVIRKLNPNNNYGTDLFTVSIHEIGHSLGLSHSSVRNAIMFPYYNGAQPNLKLHYDDIMGLQNLYGKRRSDSGSLQ